MKVLGAHGIHIQKLEEPKRAVACITNILGSEAVLGKKWGY